MMDTADEEGLHVDAPLLERTFGAPVIPISAKTGSGLRELREAMEQDVAPPRPVTRTLAAPLLEAAQKVAGMLPSTGPLATLNRFHVAMALLLDEGEDDSLMRAVPPAIRREVLALRALLNAEIPEWRSHEPIGHYRSIEDLIRRATLRVKPETSVRERIDRVLTHRVFGPLIFIAFMAVIFQSLFMWAQPLMNAIDFGVSALGRFIGPWLPAGPIRSLVVDGAIAGVGAVVTFVPQIAFLFLFISLMEDSGYLARAAFIDGHAGQPGSHRLDQHQPLRFSLQQSFGLEMAQDPLPDQKLRQGRRFGGRLFLQKLIDQLVQVPSVDEIAAPEVPDKPFTGAQFSDRHKCRILQLVNNIYGAAQPEAPTWEATGPDWLLTS